MTIRIYTKEYAGLLQNIFATKQKFLRTFGGNLQVKDGIKNKDTFMELKVQDTEAVIQDYKTDADIAFGAGTGNSSRFGERKEIIAVDADVEYEKPIAMNEGIDKMTVNDDFEATVADRMEAQSIALTNYLNGLLSKALSDNAGATLEGKLDEEGVNKAFNDAFKTLVNNKVASDLNKVAYVNADVYNILMDSKLATSAKASTVNIDGHELPLYKGFAIELLPDDLFQEGEQIIFAVDNIGVVGLGIEVFRTVESEDFAGTSVQFAGKYGKYIPEKNKKAIVKAKLAPAV